MSNTKNKILNNLPLLTVILFALILTVTIIYINSTSNILGHSYRDAYLYLIQSLKMTGVNITGYDYVDHLSPFIPFLTAILFKLGFVSETSLFITTGIFYFLGIIGMYYLLKLRFDDKISVYGAILYGSLSINLLWAGNGTLDIPSIGISIWALYFFILGMGKNQKWFYIAFPLAVLSFFAKYTGALVVAVMILYFLSKRDIFGNIKKYIKNLIIGVIAGIVITIPFFAYCFINNIPFGFLSQAQEISGRTSTSALAIANHLENQLFYYFEHIPRFIYAPNEILGYLVLILVIIGLVYGLYKFITYSKNQYKKENKISLSFLEKIKLPKAVYYIVMVLTMLFTVLSFLTASKFSFIISETLFYGSIFIFAIAFNSVFKDLINEKLISENNDELNNNEELSNKNNKKYKFFNYDLAMIGWFLGYMIFFSAHLTKADRYFTALAPAFVFFASLGLSTIIKKIAKTNKFNLKDLNKKYQINNIIIIVCIVILLISTVGYLTINKHDSLVDDEKNMSVWIKENIANYQNINISSDRAPIYTWYLQTGISYSPNGDINEINTFLDENKIDYHISTPINGTLNNYIPLKTIGDVTIYKHV